MSSWSKRLTKFEIARVLGARALQISLGAPILTKHKKDEQALTIARRELIEGRIPMIVVRKYPDGEVERVNISSKSLLESIKNFF